MKRLEVAVLVEHVVGRQQRLAEALLDAAAAQQRRAVEERPPFVGRVRFGQADEHRRQRRQLARERVERVPAAAHEAGAEQQIARQVADQRQLRRDREIGAAAPPPARSASRISRALPARSPTVGLICSSAIFTVDSDSRGSARRTVALVHAPAQHDDRRYASHRTCNRLVILAPNWLGDAVMALPAIADVRRASPGGVDHRGGAAGDRAALSRWCPA